MHANGDGIADFQGLIRRLDYLQGMGVMAVWLIPFQLSPRKDDGYDVAITAGSIRVGMGRSATLWSSHRTAGSEACAC